MVAILEDSQAAWPTKSPIATLKLQGDRRCIPEESC